jgi:hypothetical protein
MSNNGEFSEEQSEALIAHLKSADPSHFEQLRSTLNLLAHVTELPPTSIPPMLPSDVTQPIPVLPARSLKPRRTIVTTIMVVGLFASASLAAAAVTGIGPAVIVNVGHQAAKFVKGVVGGVAHVVTGNPSDVTQNQASSPQPPFAVPTVAPTISSSNEGNNQSDSEHSALVIPSLSNLFPPVSTESDSHGQDSQKSNSSHETQGPNTQDTPIAIPSGDKEQSRGEDQHQPSSRPTAKPTSESSDEVSNPLTPAPQVDQSTPSPEPTSDQSSSND